jgi:hypothetical protein
VHDRPCVLECEDGPDAINQFEFSLDKKTEPHCYSVKHDSPISCQEMDHENREGCLAC